MLKKRFLKNQCHVRFSLPEAIINDVEKAFLVGDFNSWSEQGPNALPMFKTSKTFVIDLYLALNQEYQFRYHVYLKEGSVLKEWHNDWHADKYVPAPYGGDNSVVITYSFA